MGKTPSTRSANETRRLDADAWAEAGLSELGDHGIDGVRVEVLAKRLAVTKGSFYWHFKDRDALLVSMLQLWRRRATLALIERLDQQGGSASQKLRALLRLPLKGKKAIMAAEVELAIRLWSRRDPRARAALAEVDELRLRYIERLFVEGGMTLDEARARAVLAYSYQRVAATLLSSQDNTLIRTCEDLLIGSVA